MKITEEQLKRIYPNSTAENRHKYLPFFNANFEKYDVKTFEQVCAFLAQVGHESGELKYSEEIASGKAYEGRSDLGNNIKGDGVKYKGRGLIQITGRANYRKISEDLKLDFINYPQWLSAPAYAVMSAFWFWKRNNLNRFASLKDDDFKTLTRRINGGLNGYADRVRLWDNAKAVMK